MAIAPTDAVVEPPKPDNKTNHVLETPIDSPDPDELELQTALQAEKDEAAGVVTPPPAEEVPAPGAAPAPSPAPAPTPAPEGYVPVAALQGERQKRQELEDDIRKRTETAAYWKGVAEGRLPDPRAPTVAPAAVIPEGDQQKKEIRSQIKDLAKQVDDGKLSMEEYHDQRSVLDDQLESIQAADIEARIKKSIPTPDNDLYLSTLTAKVEDENPWLSAVPSDELSALVPFAKKSLAAAGFDLDKHAGTAIGDYRLREAVVARAKQFGFDKMYGTGDAAPAPAAEPTAVPTAADLAIKKGLAAAAPPTPSGVNAPSTTWNEERIETMDSLDLENMPLSKLKEVGDILDRQVAATKATSPRGR